jgi:predicted component of type VI protein secretion system
MIYIFRDLRIILNSTKLRQVYLTLVESVINYGIIGWDGAFNNVLKEIQVCRNQILKVTFNITLRYHTENLYKELKLLPIQKLYYKTIVIS